MWIVSPRLLLICGNWWSKVEKGMKNQWLLEPPPKSPFSSMMPMTVYFQPFSSTVLLSGLSLGKSAFWTSVPMTQTSDECAMSVSVKKRPCSTKWLFASV